MTPPAPGGSSRPMFLIALLLSLALVSFSSLPRAAALGAPRLKVLTDRDLEAGLFRRDFSRMEPNATYKGVEGVFIPHAQDDDDDLLVVAGDKKMSPTTTTTTTAKPTTTTTVKSTTVEDITSSTVMIVADDKEEEDQLDRRARAFGWFGTPPPSSSSSASSESSSTEVVLEQPPTEKTAGRKAFLWWNDAADDEGPSVVDDDVSSSTQVALNSAATEEQDDDDASPPRRRVFPWWNAGGDDSSSSTTASDSSSTTTTSTTTTTAATEATTASTVVLATEDEKELTDVKKEKVAPVPAPVPRKSDDKVVKEQMDSASLVFSNLPVQDKLPSIDSSNGVVRLDMYADEPCTIGAYSASNREVWVDMAKPIGNMTGGVARESWVSVIPRGEIGSVQNMTLWLSDMSRDHVTPVTISARLVESQNPNLASLSVKPGRLDPIFHPHSYGYYIRLPESAKSFVLDFTLMNDRNARCTLDGGKEYTAGHGRAVIKVPPPKKSKAAAGDQQSFELQCYSADGTQSVRYLLNLVRQYDGDTTLRDLQVMGGAMTIPFDPLYKGPYGGDLIRGAIRDDGQEIEWTQIRAIPSNPEIAIVKIDGVQTTAEQDWKSNWFRVPRGQKRRVKINVSTPNNPVAETYVIDLTREIFGASWYQTTQGLNNAGKYVAVISGLLGGASSNAGWLMNNIRFGQLISTLGHAPQTPEYFDNFAKPFNPINLQSNNQHTLKLHLVNDSYADGTYTPQSPDSPLNYNGNQIPPYKFHLLGQSAAAKRPPPPPSNNKPKPKPKHPPPPPPNKRRLHIAHDQSAGLLDNWFGGQGNNAPNHPPSPPPPPSNNKKQRKLELGDQSAGLFSWFGGKKAPPPPPPRNPPPPPKNNKRPPPPPPKKKGSPGRRLDYDDMVAANAFDLDDLTGRWGGKGGHGPGGMQQGGRPGGHGKPQGGRRLDDWADIVAGFEDITGKVKRPPPPRQPPNKKGPTKCPPPPPPGRRLADDVEAPAEPRGWFNWGRGRTSGDETAAVPRSLLDIETALAEEIGSWSGGIAVYELSDVGSGLTLVDDNVVFPRRLTPMSPEDRSEIISSLEGARKAHENVTLYATTLTLATLALSIVATVYSIVWFSYLSAAASGSTETNRESNITTEGGGEDYELIQPLNDLSSSQQLPQLSDSENISAAGCQFAMRADFPTILHPVRFFSWFGDFAFIAYTQASVGILMAKGDLYGPVTMFNGLLTIPLIALKAIAAVLFISCLAYLLWGTACLVGAQSRVVFGNQFCEYHDAVLTKAKATWKPHWTRWLGSFSKAFQVEISSVAPLQAANDRESRAVIFDADKAAGAEMTTQSPMASHYGYDRLPNAADESIASPPKYRREGDAVEVAINDRLYTSINENYDRHNAAFVERYPDAKIGETNFVLKNAYGYPVQLNADLQLKHITSLMQLMDNFPFWLPRENCQMPIKDALFNLFSQAGRGLFLDWAINRGLLFLTLVTVTAIASSSATSTSSGSAAILVLAIYSLVSGVVRVPFAAAAGMSKYSRDALIWEEELNEMRAACAEARNAESIWPFNEPGFSDRFRLVREKKRRALFGVNQSRQAKADALFHAASPNVDQEAALAEMHNHGFFHTPAWYVMKEIVLSVGFADILFGIAAVIVFFQRRSAILSAAFTTPLIVLPIIFSAVCLLNVRPAHTFWLGIQSIYAECLKAGAWFTVATHDLLFGIGGIGARMSHFGTQLGKCLSKDPTLNWHYPKTGRAVRRFPVDEATIVSNELGMHLDARAQPASIYLQATVPDQNRLKLHKTLVVKGGLGDSRRDLYRSLPVQVPFCRLFTYDGNGFALRLNSDAPIDRLVATVQVVNHTFRANAAGLPALKDTTHDSFLSLYANPDFFPAPGKIRLRKAGHTYSVRYDPDHCQLVVRGPAITQGRHYWISTAENQPERKYMYQNAANPTESVSDDSVYPARSKTAGTGTAFCKTPGTLRVEVGGHGTLAPDLYKMIDVQTPIGTTIEINPMEIKVHYDIDCSELFLRHEDFMPSDSPYHVSWYVKPQQGQKIKADAVAAVNGSVVFDVPPGETPDLESWLTLRDEMKATIDIDPKQTDAYQIMFPEKAAASGHAWKTAIGRLNALSRYCSGDELNFSSHITEEPIPCTVVQCVNPIERIFRVDPDFLEAHRILKARVHEYRAHQRAVDAEISSLWPTIMSVEEYVAFWKARGVSVVDEMGNVIDPLSSADRDDERFQAVFKEVAVGDVELRSVCSARLDQKIAEIENQMDRVRVWIRAYADPNLHTAQLERDRADWNLREDESLQSQSMALADQKAMYESECDNFVYPCNIPDCFIARRPNLAAQFRLWLDHLQSWLICEEGCEVQTKAGQQRVASITADIMQALKLTLFSNEVRTTYDYRSVLHYAISSHMLRGLNTFWCPDTIKAHPACVRAWTVKDDERTADFDCLPERIPCLLRLTPNALQILMPNAGDLSRNCKPTDYPWQNSTGLYIPLHAFQKFELIRDSSLPAATSDPKPFAAMTTKLVCRKNQRADVDDGFVRRTEDGQIGNDITFDDATGNKVRFRIMIGHCVPPHEVRDRLAEVDESIEAPFVNIYPLTFNMNPAFADQWERAIKMASLDQPHDFPCDGAIREETVSSSSTPPPPPPAVYQPPPPPPVVEEKPKEVIKAEPRERRPRASDYVLFSSNVGGDSSSQSSMMGQQSLGQRYVYEGDGKLMKPRGGGGRTVVYNGPWENGQRHGDQCEYFFSDSYKKGGEREWKYSGSFMHDQMVGRVRITLQPGEMMNDLAQLGDSSRPERMTPVAIEGTLRPPSPHREQQIPATVETRMLHSMVPAVILKSIFDSPLYEPDDEEMGSALRDFVPSGGELDSSEREALIRLLSSVYWRDNEIICDGAADHEVFSNSHLIDLLLEALPGPGQPASHELSGVAALLCNLFPHRTRWLREMSGRVAVVFSRISEGTMRLADGSVYHGGAVDGLPHGEGLLHNPILGVTYQGGFDAGKPHGYGVLEVGAGGNSKSASRFAAYYGAFSHGERQGEGQLNSANDKVYVRGDWDGDRLRGDNGCAIVISPDYAAARKFNFVAYEGRLVSSSSGGYVPSKDETNKTYFMSGLVYIGGYDENGRRSGMGRLVRYDDKGKEEVLYAGNFVANLPQGSCSRFVLPDGNVYIGGVQGGYRHGMGELYRVDPNSKALILIYEGLWFNDRPHGRGMYIGSDGEYDGEWARGKREGKGRFSYRHNALANGKFRVYEGNWHDDQPHGTGRYLSQNAADNVYRFDKGVIVEQSVSSYKPCCGSAPDIQKNEAVVKPAANDFAMIIEKDCCWEVSKAAIKLEYFKQIVDEVTLTSAASWKNDYLKHYQFVDPNNLDDSTPLQPSPVSRHQPVILNPKGQIMPSAEFKPPPHTAATPHTQRDVVKLFVVEGRNMKCGPKSDPYVKVTYGSTTKKTKRINSGGPNTKFNKTLLFPAEANVNEMSIEVYDSDRLSHDDFIGRAVVPLEALRPDTEDVNKVVNLQHTKNGKREDRGQIVISLFRTKVSDLLQISTQSSQNTNASQQAGYGPHLRTTIHNVHNIVIPPNQSSSALAPSVQVTLGHKEANTAVGTGLNVPFDETLFIPYNGHEQARFALIDRAVDKKPVVMGRAVINIKEQPEFSGLLKFTTDSGEVVGVLDVSVTLKK